jgi:hypothetical protein
MPQMGVVVDTRPDREDGRYALPYCYHALKYAVDYMRGRGMTVIDLERDMAVREQVLDALRRYDPILYFGCGHGSPSEFTGQYVRTIFYACDSRELAGRVVYLLSCETGQRLGPDIISKGGRAYVGYKEDFGFYTPASDRPEDVMNDPMSRAFFEPVVTLLNALADGRTVGDAHRASLERWNYWIDYWSRQPGGSRIVAWLVHDRDAQVLLGDASAVVNVALRLPLPPLPFVAALVSSAGAAFAASG